MIGEKKITIWPSVFDFSKCFPLLPILNGDEKLPKPLDVLNHEQLLTEADPAPMDLLNCCRAAEELQEAFTQLNSLGLW